MAEPPAPAMSRAVTIGLASRRTASTDADPVKDCAPSWRVREPSCSAITAPNGIATSAVGRIVTLATNQVCWMNSRIWNGRLGSARMTSRAKAKSFPLVASGRVGEKRPSSRPGAFGWSVAVTRRLPAGAAWRSGPGRSNQPRRPPEPSAGPRIRAWT